MSAPEGGSGRLAKARAGYAALPAILHATVEATVATLFFTGMSLLIRHISAELHPFEIVFFRNLLGVACMLPWFMRVGARGLRTRRIGGFVVRAGLSLVGMTAGFTAYTLIPLTDATALAFTAPLFATIGAAVFLGETVRFRRWSAILLGFAGTMIVLRPGVEALQLGALLALLNALTVSINNLMVKSLARTETSEAIVTYMVLLLTPISLIPALFVWQWPSLPALFWLSLLAICGTAGHWYLTRAYAKADVTFVMPFDFLRLPLTALFAFLLFAEVPTIYTWIGGAVIFASTFYLVRRESQLARERRRAQGLG